MTQTIISQPASGLDDPRHDADSQDKEKNQEIPASSDTFGDEQDAEIKYKVLSWW